MKTFRVFIAFVATTLSLQAQGDKSGPAADFQRSDDPAVVSPEGTLEVRQYYKTGDDYVYQFWTFDRKGGHAHLLNPGETGDTAGYPADFRFSKNGQWLVRLQKIAAGESTLFLYKRDGMKFVPATPKPLGDLAWKFFLAQPEAKGIDSTNLSSETYLIKGLDSNYAAMGEHWPDSRYLMIGLSSGESGTAVAGPWHCVYDTQTGTFSVPPDVATYNKSKMPWKQ